MVWELNLGGVAVVEDTMGEGEERGRSGKEGVLRKRVVGEWVAKCRETRL